MTEQQAVTRYAAPMPLPPFRVEAGWSIDIEEGALAVLKPGAVVGVMGKHYLVGEDGELTEVRVTMVDADGQPLDQHPGGFREIKQGDLFMELRPV